MTRKDTDTALVQTLDATAMAQSYRWRLASRVCTNEVPAIISVIRVVRVRLTVKIASRDGLSESELYESNHSS